MNYSKKKDQIIIHNLEVFCNHGVYKEENVLGQKFLVDVVMHTDNRTAGLSDRLEDSVNYGEVCRLIEEVMKQQNDKLIERVAERIATSILRNYHRIDNVEVEVKKPWAPVMRHIEYASVRIQRRRHKAYIGLGSNMGDRESYLNHAIEAIDSLEDVNVCKKASILETEPYGYLNQDRFLNTVICVETLLDPEELLDRLMQIEKDAGRTREIHWGPRTLDLDILLYDDSILTSTKLVIPHPGIEKRKFVLDPLCEIAPYEVHPLLNKRFITLKEELDSTEY